MAASDGDNRSPSKSSQARERAPRNGRCPGASEPWQAARNSVSSRSIPLQKVRIHGIRPSGVSRGTLARHAVARDPVGIVVVAERASRPRPRGAAPRRGRLAWTPRTAVERMRWKNRHSDVDDGVSHYPTAHSASSHQQDCLILNIREIKLPPKSDRDNEVWSHVEGTCEAWSSRDVLQDPRWQAPGRRTQAKARATRPTALCAARA